MAAEEVVELDSFCELTNFLRRENGGFDEPEALDCRRANSVLVQA